MVNLLPWAERFLRTVPRPIPRYGSAEWAALSRGDVRRWAAVVVAAEMWRDYTSTEATAERLAEELDAEQRRCVQRWGDAANDVRGRARIADGLAGSEYPSHAEMTRRRYGNGSGPPVGGPDVS